MLHAGHLAEAIRRERAIVEDLAAEGFETEQATSYLEDQEAVLSRMVEGIRLLGQCPDETRARILATGEGFASRLMVDVLNARGYDAMWSDTDVLPPANDDWLDSLVDIDAAAPQLTARLEEEDSQVVVLPGFYGRNAQNKIQLMGRNGTDYSAAAIAAGAATRARTPGARLRQRVAADARFARGHRHPDRVDLEVGLDRLGQVGDRLPIDHPDAEAGEGGGTVRVEPVDRDVLVKAPQ